MGTTMPPRTATVEAGRNHSCPILSALYFIPNHFPRWFLSLFTLVTSIHSRNIFSGGKCEHFGSINGRPSSKYIKQPAIIFFLYLACTASQTSGSSHTYRSIEARQKARLQYHTYKSGLWSLPTVAIVNFNSDKICQWCLLKEECS